jgi:hypothetical protein
MICDPAAARVWVRCWCGDPVMHGILIRPAAWDLLMDFNLECRRDTTELSVRELLMFDRVAPGVSRLFVLIRDEPRSMDFSFVPL